MALYGAGLVVAMLLAAPTPASEATSAQSAPLASKGSFIAISVADMDATERWYIDKFGLKRVLALPVRDGRAMRLLEGDGMIVELIKDPDARPLKALSPPIERDYLVHGIFKGGIFVGDFNAAIARLKERGVAMAFGPFPATAEQRANAIIRDNEGNFLQIIGDYSTAPESPLKPKP